MMMDDNSDVHVATDCDDEDDSFDDDGITEHC